MCYNDLQQSYQYTRMCHPLLCMCLDLNMWSQEHIQLQNKKVDFNRALWQLFSINLNGHYNIILTVTIGSKEGVCTCATIVSSEVTSTLACAIVYFACALPRTCGLRNTLSCKSKRGISIEHCGNSSPLI